MMLAAIIDLIKSIPATFWGVIVGSVFTLVGVVATNRHAGWRLAIQLKQDRELKAQERELALRKEIYLGAAEAIAEAMNLIPRYADLNIAQEKLTERFSEKSAAMTKVHVIAGQDTAQAIVNFTTELGAAILHLSATRYPLLSQHQQIALLNDEINSFGKERDKLLEAINKMNIEGIKDERRFNVLNQGFEFEQRRVIERLEKIDKLREDLRKKQLDYLQECMTTLHALRSLLLPVLSAVRNELHVPVDEATYAAIMAAGQAKEQSYMKGFLEVITAPKTV